MRYPSSEKLEIIKLVEQSHLPAKHTLDRLGIPRTTFPNFPLLEAEVYHGRLIGKPANVCT